MSISKSTEKCSVEFTKLPGCSGNFVKSSVFRKSICQKLFGEHLWETAFGGVFRIPESFAKTVNNF